MEPTRVLLAGFAALEAASLTALLAEEPDVEVVGSVERGFGSREGAPLGSAVSEAKRLRADTLVLAVGERLTPESVEALGHIRLLLMDRGGTVVGLGLAPTVPESVKDDASRFVALIRRGADP